MLVYNTQLHKSKSVMFQEECVHVCLTWISRSSSEVLDFFLILETLAGPFRERERLHQVTGERGTSSVDKVTLSQSMGVTIESVQLVFPWIRTCMYVCILTPFVFEICTQIIFTKVLA